MTGELIQRIVRIGVQSTHYNDRSICSQLVDMLNNRVAIGDMYINVLDKYGDPTALTAVEITNIEFWPAEWELTEAPALKEFQPAIEWMLETEKGERNE